MARRQLHRVKEIGDYGLDKMRRVNRRALTDETWNSLLEHYRQYPGDHAGASSRADVAYNTARKAWEQGVAKAGRPPIKELVAQEAMDLRRELVDLRRLTTTERAIRDKKASDDLQDDKVLAARILRSARSQAAGAMALSGNLLRMAHAVSQHLADDLDGDPNALTAQQKLNFIKAAVRVTQMSVEAAGVTTRMARDELGGPEVVQIVGVDSEDAARAILEQGQRTLRRVNQMAAKNKLMDDPDVMDADFTPQAPQLPPGTSQFPGAGARVLDLAASSNVREARYDPTQSVLWVTFTNGGYYRYQDVPPDIIQDWEGAESAGSYFSNAIKDDFDGQRIG